MNFNCEHSVLKYKKVILCCAKLDIAQHYTKF